MYIGVDGMIKDTISLHVLIQSIGQIKDDGQQVCIVHNIFYNMCIPYTLCVCTNVCAIRKCLPYSVIDVYTNFAYNYFILTIYYTIHPIILYTIQVRMQYYSELDDGIMSYDSFMCRWLMKTENAVERGARYVYMLYSIYYVLYIVIYM